MKDAASSDTTSTETVASELMPKPLRGGRDAGWEMGRRWRGQQQKQQETDLCVPDLQASTRNKGKSYYYFTTSYCCSISLSSLSVQTSNFAATPTAFDLHRLYLEICIVITDSVKSIRLSYCLPEFSLEIFNLLQCHESLTINFKLLLFVNNGSQQGKNFFNDVQNMCFSCKLDLSHCLSLGHGLLSCIIVISLANLVFYILSLLFLFSFILIDSVSEFISVLFLNHVLYSPNHISSSLLLQFITS